MRVMFSDLICVVLLIIANMPPGNTNSWSWASTFTVAVDCLEQFVNFQKTYNDNTKTDIEKANDGLAKFLSCQKSHIQYFKDKENDKTQKSNNKIVKSRCACAW